MTNNVPQHIITSLLEAIANTQISDDLRRKFMLLINALVNTIYTHVIASRTHGLYQQIYQQLHTDLALKSVAKNAKKLRFVLDASSAVIRYLSDANTSSSYLFSESVTLPLQLTSRIMSQTFTAGNYATKQLSEV